MIEINHAVANPQEPIKMTEIPGAKVDYSEPKVLLADPSDSSIDCPNNIWMEEEAKNGKPEYDVDNAYAEWEGLKESLEEVVKVEVVPTKKGLQDLVYVANLGFMLAPGTKFKDGRDATGTFIFSNFRSKPRVGEPEAAIPFFNKGTVANRYIQCPYFFEGSADIKYLYGNIYVGGYGIRTDKRAYEWMESMFDIKIIKMEMFDPYLYHFDCNFLNLDAEKALVAVNSFEEHALDELYEHIDIVECSEDDSYGGSCNSFVAEGCLFNSADVEDKSIPEEVSRIKNMEKMCAKLGLEYVPVPLTEFVKGGAMLSCCVNDLTYHSYR